MTIQVKLPNGSLANFPDGTPENVITGAITDHLTNQQAVSDVVTSPDFAPGLAQRLAADPNLTPTDPGFIGRFNQRAEHVVHGQPVPPLKTGASMPSQLAETTANVMDYISGLSRAGQRGVTFGLSDDAAALGGAAREATPGLSSNNGQSFGQNFQNMDRAENAQIDQFKQQNPIIGNTAEIAGMVAAPFGSAGTRFISRGANMGTRALRAAGVGGGLGTAAGFAGADGSFDARANAALYSGAIGTAGVGILTPLGESLGGLGRTAIDTARNQYLAWRNPANQAHQLLANALVRDRQGVPAAVTKLAGYPDLGLVNAGGPNTAALGRAATVAPGEARTMAEGFLENQAGGMPDRSADAVRRLSPQGYYGTLEQLDQTRRATALPLYQAAYGQPAVDQWSPEIANLMQRPSMRDAAGKANRIAAEEGRNPTELGLDFNAAGDPVFVAGARNGQIPSVQTMDYMKRGLDDVLEQYRDPVTRELVLDTAGRAAQNTRRQYVTLLRAGNPNYAAALDAWGGPSHSIDMLNLGRKMFQGTGDPTPYIREFQQLTPAEQNMVRTGIMRDATNKIGTLGDNSSVYQALTGSTNKRAMFETAFPSPDEFGHFMDAMRQERQLLRTNRMISGGSPTASRLAENDDATQQAATVASALHQALTGRIPQAIGTAVTKAGNVRRGMTEPVANELGRILFNADPGQNATTLQALAQLPQYRGLMQALATKSRPSLALNPATTNLLTNLTGQGAGQLGAGMVQ